MSWIRATLGDISSGRVLDVATGWGRFIEDLRFQHLDQLLKGPKPVPDSEPLCSRAAALRQRLHTVGFTSATLLTAVGIK